MLEDHADPAAQRFRLHGENAFTIDENIAALRLDQTVEPTQQGRLAGTGRADDAGDAARFYRKVDPFSTSRSP